MNPTPAARDHLLALAAEAIHTGFDARPPRLPVMREAPAEIRLHRACFVTLTTEDAELRGCRGTLEPGRALALDVWHNARASAFEDPRFPPLVRSEYAEIEIAISILGDLQPLPIDSEEDLLAALRPGHDGLVLSWRQRRATFLPAVWDTLSEPRRFLGELKRKAGLPADFWADDLCVQRYITTTIRGAARDHLAAGSGS